jgi:acetyltransferase-like isoleucine patch superfamily enzyme
MMFKLIRFGFRLARYGWRRSRQMAGSVVTRVLFYLNHVQYGAGLNTYGVPVVDINDDSSMTIGTSFQMNSGRNHNRIGRQQPCYFIADLGGRIHIGNRVGMSSTALVCHHAISIGDDVLIGGNTVIYDTDFHPLRTDQRTRGRDNSLARTAPVVIQNGVFVGAHVTILKGVTIGQNAVIAAGSVVTKDIPANQIWGGNPAQFIRALEPQPIYE